MSTIAERAGDWKAGNVRLLTGKRSRFFDPMETRVSDGYSTSIMVALLPAGSLAWSKLDLPHVTIVYGGSTGAADAPDRQQLELMCSEAADSLGVIIAPVTGLDVFGPENDRVDVLRLEPTWQLQQLRTMFEPANRSEYKDFKPHATVGPKGSAAGKQPEYLKLDRLLLSWGSEEVIWFLHGDDAAGLIQLEGRAAGKGGQFAKGGGRVPGRGSLSQSDLADFSTPAGATAWANLEPDGNGGMRFTAERAALHEKLIGEQLAGLQRSANPTTTVLGGGPGAGKSSSAEAAGVPPKGKAAWADPDTMKQGLPEYDPKNPSPVHEESSYLAKQVTARAQALGYDVVIDGVGDNPASMAAKVSQARAAGHRVVANYTTTTVEIAQERNRKRDRSVDPDMLADKHAKVSRNFTKIAELDFDEVTLWENNWQPGLQSALVKVASKNGGSPLSVLDEGAWTSFLAKG